MSILRHKDYEGTVETDLDRLVCHGKILFIDDLVTYEAKTLPDLKKEFEAAVEDYLETCRQLNRPAQKPLRGQFNVRIAPELHKAAVVRAAADGVTLNAVVVRALEGYLSGPTQRQGITLVVREGKGVIEPMLSSSSMEEVWGTRSVYVASH
jgi:predicted HicB family RNase H-like nuclease